MATFTGPDVVSEGLVFCFDAGNTKSYPGSGTIITDISGNNNEGTLVNNVGYSNDGGGTLVFNGSNKVSTPFKPSGPRSYFIWVKYNSLSGPDGYQLTGTQEVNAYSYIGIINGGNVYYYAGASTGGTIPNSALSPNIWYQQGFVLFPDGSRKIYTNGIEIASSSGGLGGTATREFSVGCINNSYDINGNISRVSVYNRALTDIEVKKNFERFKGRFGI